jgi:hypothetical protein
MKKNDRWIHLPVITGILKDMELSSGFFSLPCNPVKIIKHPKNVIPQRGPLSGRLAMLRLGYDF